MHKWLLFILLSIIWGSSFILIKAGLIGLNAYQVASLRIVAAGLALLPLFIKDIKTISRKDILPVFLSGTFGNLIPAYLFAMAQKNIPSGVAGVLNSLTPIFAFIIGWQFFNAEISKNKSWGIAVAFFGALLLSYANNLDAADAGSLKILPILLILIATLFYGYNVNFVKHYLSHRPSAATAATALGLNAIPALAILAFTGFFSGDLTQDVVLHSIGYVSLLGILGSAIATVLFYSLLKKAGVVFSSMVTYAIPIVAVIWGVVFGEQFTLLHFLSFIIILTGVFIANKKTGK